MLASPSLKQEMASCTSSPPSGPFSRSDSDATRPPSFPRHLVKDFAWAPGGGVPNYPFGPAEERATRDRLHRTSLLVIELEQQVRDCVDRKRAHDASSRAESYRIAMAHPIKFAPPAAAEPVFQRTPTGEWHAVFEPAAQQEASQRCCTALAPAASEQHAPATQRAAEEEEPVSKKARSIAVSELPAPLKRHDLDAAYLQLPAGAEVAIEASINMWREKRLDLSEVMATVTSFESRSPVLKKALLAHRKLTLSIKVPTTPVECEVATPEQMRELSAMWVM